MTLFKVIENSMMKHMVVVMMTMCFCFELQAQSSDTAAIRFMDNAPDYRPARGRWVGAGLAAGYAGTMSALYTTWYSDYPLEKFHGFNDNNEWLQMDKVGHAGSVYYLSRWTSGLFRWTGKNDRASAVLGTGSAWLFLLTIEVFDGFSTQWGFSTGDLLANTAGAGLYLGQQLGWKEQRVTFKYSYHKDPIAELRPGTFGKDLSENVLKDYNGQTYWLSANIQSFLPDKTMPSWLNIALGYGAGGMIAAEKNAVLDNGIIDPGTRFRQFYLSPDIDWTRIRTNRKWLRTVFTALNFIKLPAPTLEFRDNGRWIVHGLYF